MNSFNQKPKPKPSSSSSSSISICHNAHFTFDDVESIFRPLFQSYYGAEGLRSLIYNANHTWCAYDKQINKFVGCGLVENYDKDRVLYIKLFGVEKSSQGQGIGTQLLKAIKKWGRRHNYTNIILHTQVNNHKAIGLYEKSGFRKQYYLRDFFPENRFLSFFQSAEPDAYQMILHL